MSESFDKWFWNNVAKLDDPIEEKEENREVIDRPIVKKKKRQRYVNNKRRHR